MNKVFYISIFALLVSCGVRKERKAAKQAAKIETATNETTAEVKENKVSERPRTEEEMILVEATVRLDRPGCPVSLDMVQGDLFSTAYPVNLPKEFQKEGLRLRFTFLPSKAASPESCTADMVIAMDNIIIIK